MRTIVRSEHRAIWPKLKKLLLTRDTALIDQGVELVRALGDATLFAELLRGVTWTPGTSVHEESSASYGTLVTQDTYFADTAPAAPFRTRAVLALAAAAPPGCEPADALKESLTSLRLLGDGDARRPIAIDLAPLAAFTKLERLLVWGRTPPTHGAALEGHPALRTLVSSDHALATLPDLTKLPALTSLSLSQTAGDLAAVLPRLTGLRALVLNRVTLPPDVSFESFGALRTLTLGHVPVQAVSLRGCAALASLDVDWTPVRTLDVTGCAALAELRMHACREIREIKGLASLTSLRLLVADYCIPDWMPTAPVPALTALKTLTLSSYDSGDAARIAHFPAVERLTVRNSIGFRDLTALATMTTLREVDFSFSMSVHDLSPLAQLPLTSLNVHYTGVASRSVPKSLRAVVRWQRP